jgi:Glycosyltransferase family 20
MKNEGMPRGCAASWASAPTPCSAWASTASTTPKASRSASPPWTPCSSATPKLRGRFTFAQLAAPSRTRIARYQELNDRVEALANKINERWSTGDYRPVVLLRAHHEPPAVFRYSARPTSAT